MILHQARWPFTSSCISYRKTRNVVGNTGCDGSAVVAFGTVSNVRCLVTMASAASDRLWRTGSTVVAGSPRLLIPCRLTLPPVPYCHATRPVDAAESRLHLELFAVLHYGGQGTSRHDPTHEMPIKRLPKHRRAIASSSSPLLAVATSATALTRHRKHSAATISATTSTTTPSSSTSTLAGACG
ncbi:hypothetical protein SAMN05660971_00460 [Halomonas cupida]|uniref:Uncharacterized protein n=1 Tax=Halomonas cupida TaxID=44933 RepID=A0A1M7ACR3_9GAMM|nr:hypothetical protein SAMN05660971_00460 [Halomonas cupida]